MRKNRKNLAKVEVCAKQAPAPEQRYIVNLDNPLTRDHLVRLLWWAVRVDKIVSLTPVTQEEADNVKLPQHQYGS